MSQTISKEIDIFKALQLVIKKRKFVIIFVILGTIIGIINTYSIPEKYQSSISFITSQAQQSNGRNPAIKLFMEKTSNEGEVPIILFDNLLRSYPVKEKIAQIPVTIKRIGKTISYQEYIENYLPTPTMASVKKYTIGFPSLLFSKKTNKKQRKKQDFSLNNIRQYSASERMVFNHIDNNLAFTREENGLLKISFSMEDPIASAQMTQETYLIFQDFLRQHKLKKTIEKVTYTEELFKNAEKDFKEKQFRLANFQDSNRGLITYLPQTRLSTLQAEYNISYQIFMELAKELEKQKMLVKDKNIVFTVIDPVDIPTSSANNSRIIGVLKYSFGSLFIALMLIFGWFIFINLKKMYNEQTQEILNKTI